MTSSPQLISECFHAIRKALSMVVQKDATHRNPEDTPRNCPPITGIMQIPYVPLVLV